MVVAKSNAVFREAYNKLNKEQKHAVDTIEGPVMVVAGPGTGKTQTIALRIANILQKTDTNPSSILALTFTESAAREMKERLTRFIGHTAYYVQVSTFHGFCVDVIRDNPDSFTIDPAAEPLTELDKLKLFRGFLDSGGWRDIRPVNAPYHYVKGLISAIQDLKREGVEPDAFKEVLDIEDAFLEQKGEELKKVEFAKRKRSLAKNRELLRMYRLYQDTLAASKEFDFEDMIGHVSRAFAANPDLLLDYQERFQYILVDEYQDTNSAQDRVVRELASFHGQSANLFVVGDPDQSIMRFQGASIENMLGFVRDFPGTAVVTLRDNYRSAQSILDSAHNLIEQNELRIDDVVVGIDPHLRAAKVKEYGVIEAVTTPSALAEDIYLAEHIQKLIGSGVPPSEIVVIYRKNADGPPLAETLAKFKIDYVVQGGGNILAELVIQRLLKIFRVIDEMRTKQDDPNLFTILNYDIFGIAPLDVLKISRLAADKRVSLFDVMTNKELLKELDLSTHDKIEKVLEMLAEWQDIDANSTFTQFFENVLNDSGYLDSILRSVDVHNNIARVNTLFSAVKKMNAGDHHLNLKLFLENIDLMEENNVRIEEQNFARREDAITLTTAHSAKGLEWEHVFLYKTYDGMWGNKRVSDLFRFPAELLPNTDLTKKEKNEDERRLFYVAATRAKSHLYMTRATEYQQSGRARQVAPSMFTVELGEHVEPIELKPKEEQAIADDLKKILTPTGNATRKKNDGEMSREERAYLTGLIERFKLSPTALNTYLKCPYQFKLNNLLKVPRAKAPHLAFGTAVHGALESFYNQIKGGSKAPDKDYLFHAFALALKSEILTDQEAAARLRQGREVLGAYYDMHEGSFTAPISLEKNIRVVLPGEEGGMDITLSGKIDRIDWVDQVARSVRVVDYKTGDVKTQGQIMGTTTDSTGDLHRQLVFYRLLMDLSPTLNYRFAEAELDFVEGPEEKGKSGRFRFPISDDEVQELKVQIRDVMRRIRTLEFPRGVGNHGDCDACNVYDHLWPSA